MPSKNILVTGATGYIGGRLVPRLLEKNYRVRCLARRPEILRARPWGRDPRIEIVAGDVLDPASLRPALEGVSEAYYLVHSMTGGEEGFEDRDRWAALNFSNAAKSAGVQHIFYLGGLGSHEQELSPHLKSRQEVGDILRASGIPVTEFRAAIIVGAGSVSFEMIRYLAERLPVMICPQWVGSLCQPIAIRDVLSYLTAALEEPQSAGEVLEIGGADVLTYRDMMMQYGEVRGLKRRLWQISILTPRVSSYWVDLVTPIPSSLARPLIEGLKNDVVCRNRKARDLFPQIQPLPYREAVRLALERIERGQVETIWSGAQSSVSLDHPEEFSLESREGMIIERRDIEVSAPPTAVFRVFSGIGGTRKWFYADDLWQLRGFVDRLLGGVGMRRGRRDPDSLIPGDAVDFWRVEEVEPGRLIRLRAEMKVPGKAWLQLEALPGDDAQHAVYRQTAFFEPKGLWGLLYWYCLYPIHYAIFSGLSLEMKKRVETLSNPS